MLATAGFTLSIVKRTGTRSESARNVNPMMVNPGSVTTVGVAKYIVTARLVNGPGDRAIGSLSTSVPAATVTAGWLPNVTTRLLTADEVKDLVRANRARHCVPREVVFLDELPRNATGKVVKRELRPA